MSSPPSRPETASSPPGAGGPGREQVGIVGLGLMGTAMTERLLARGFDVVGHDVDALRREDLARRGGCPAGSVAEVLVSCRRILLSLPDSEVVRDVLEQARPHLRPGHLVVDTTTGRPADALEAARLLHAHGADYLEALVSGNSSQVRAGEVLVLAGGDATALARCDDLLACFATEVVPCGDAGNASRMKLVTNLVLGLNRAVLAEGLAFAGALGLDPGRSLAVLRRSMGYSRVMDTKGDKMVAGDFVPQARLSQHLKDVRLLLEAATATGQRLPLSEAHRRLLEAAERLGLGELDNSAILRAIQASPHHPDLP